MHQLSLVEMENIFMRSIKTLAWRPLQFLKSLISPSNVTLAEPIAPEEPKAEEPATQASLDELNLSPRVFNCLWKSNIRNIETVASMSDENLLDIPGFGVKALTELKERMLSCGISENKHRP